MWGRNVSQIIREDKGPRYCQYEPYPVPLGKWNAIAVSGPFVWGGVSGIYTHNFSNVIKTFIWESQFNQNSFSTQEIVFFIEANINHSLYHLWMALKRAVLLCVCVHLLLVYFVTALVPSLTACLASSPGRSRRTAVWTSLDEIVDLLL